MKAVSKRVNFREAVSGKIKRQMHTALLLLCILATFAAPAFSGGYSLVKRQPVITQAAAIEDVDLPLVGASAFGEARKVMNATDNDAKDTFVNNTTSIVSYKWQNIGLLIGSRDALSGSTWSAYQNPTTLSSSEVSTYGSSDLVTAYNKYKAFGFAVQNLNNKAQKSKSSAVSVEEGLDAMSSAAIKLGNFGTEFLNKYNPGPVLLALYNSHNLALYPDNKLVQIVKGSDVLLNIVCLFGDPVPGTGLSFFLILNAVIAIIGFALSLFLTLLGNRTIGDGVRHFMIRVAVGTVGIYIIANLLSISLSWMTDTMLDIDSSPATSYAENNLNLYDWYLTGFQMPSGVTLDIDTNGNFVFTADKVKAINQYTCGRLTGSSSDEDIKARMESYTQNGNIGKASFITPSIEGADGGDAWAADVYYGIMDNLAQNKDNLMDGNDDEASPLYGKPDSFSIFMSRYLWMSSLYMNPNGNAWTVGGNGFDSYYGLNPISALNLIRTDFSGESISASYTVYPKLAYVGFDVINTYDTSGSDNMNAITRFIASFTLVLAALKGLITIFTAGFGGLLAGGAKTAFGSSGGLGQAIGAVIAVVFGVVGISVIMSMTLSLLDTIYGIAKDLIGDSEIITAFLEPLQNTLGQIPVAGPALMRGCNGLTNLILTLILALTFPKLGGIPITVFAQYMADMPGQIAEKAQMIESQLMSGRSSAGGGLGGRGRSGEYGRMARQMAGNAFSQGSRQAAQVVKAGVMGTAALAGASLATAGRMLNKKGDAVEGKPSNPGISNWDDLSPEQQAKAAEVAGSTDGWGDMSEDARQDLLNNSGIYDDNSAYNGIGEPQNNEEPEPLDNPVENTYPDGTEPPLETADSGGGGEGEMLEPEGPVIPDMGAEASMNQPETMEGTEPLEKAEGGLPEGTIAGSGDGNPAQPEKTPGEAASMNGESKEGAPAQAIEGGKPEGTDGETASAGKNDSVNVFEGSHMEGGSQQLETKVDQKNNMEATNIDESKNLNSDLTNDLGMSSTDNRNTNNTSNLMGTSGIKGVGNAPAQAGTGGVSAHTGSGSLPTGTNSERKASSGKQTGASATYKSVNNTTENAGNNNMNMNAQVKQNAQFNTGADQSRTVNKTGSPKAASSPPNDPPKDPVNLNQAKKAAEGGTTDRSMNGTSTSKWGKEMTVKEQKQARALHAVGDALQMMGGNRSMGDGIRDALGYAAEASMSALVSPEIGNGIAQDIRNKRLLRQELRRNSARETARKNKH